MASSLRLRWFDHIFSPECTLSDTDRLVAASLFKHMDTHGRCWPSGPTIAGECGKSLSSVRRAVTRLRKAGLITIPTKRPIARNGTGTAVNIYQAVIRQQSEANHSVIPVTPPSRNDSVISDGMTVSDRANDSVTAMTLKPPKEPPNRTGRTFVRKTVSEGGKERRTRALDDLVNRKSYPSHLTGDQLLPVATELSISTVGVDERQMRSAIEDRLGRLRAGESLNDLAEKKGGSGNGSAVCSMTRVIL